MILAPFSSIFHVCLLLFTGEVAIDFHLLKRHSSFRIPARQLGDEPRLPSQSPGKSDALYINYVFFNIYQFIPWKNDMNSNKNLIISYKARFFRKHLLSRPSRGIFGGFCHPRCHGGVGVVEKPLAAWTKHDPIFNLLVYRSTMIYVHHWKKNNNLYQTYQSEISKIGCLSPGLSLLSTGKTSSSTDSTGHLMADVGSKVVVAKGQQSKDLADLIYHGNHQSNICIYVLCIYSIIIYNYTKY